MSDLPQWFRHALDGPHDGCACPFCKRMPKDEKDPLGEQQDALADFNHGCVELGRA